jgi:hypothetical protein
MSDISLVSFPKTQGREVEKPSPYQIVASGVDTFIVNYKFANEQGILTGDSLPDHIQDQLDVWQKAARKEYKPVPTSLTFSYMYRSSEMVNQSLYMHPHGHSPWSWLLTSDDVKVRFAPGTLNKGLFCQVTFSSHLLWMIGPDTAIVQLESMLSDYLGGFFHEQASEIHLCADITGFDFSCLSLAGEQLPFVSRVTGIRDRPVPPTEEEQRGGLTAKEAKALQDKIDGEIQEEQERFHLASLTTTHRRISTIDFGSHASPVSAQIYNKSLEIKKHRKEWFEDIWKSNGWDGESTVWRVEFRIKRSWLRSYQLDEAFSALAQIRNLWVYLTREWLRFIDLSVVTGINVSRRPTHPVWELLQQAYENLDILAPRDVAAEEELRLKLLLSEQPLQVLEQAVALTSIATYDAMHGDPAAQTDEQQKECQTQMMVEYTDITDTLTDEPREVIQELARDQFALLTPDQQAELLVHLSPEPFYQVQAALIKRERQMTRLKNCIAGGVGYIRAAVALMSPDELPGYLGPNILAGRRFPDLLSSFLWFAEKARDYDQKKGRSHAEEVLKKQLAYGLVTAQDLEEQRCLYGVQLEPEDFTAIDQALSRLYSRRPTSQDQ